MRPARSPLATRMARALPQAPSERFVSSVLARIAEADAPEPRWAVLSLSAGLAAAALLLGIGLAAAPGEPGGLPVEPAIVATPGASAPLDLIEHAEELDQDQVLAMLVEEPS